MRGYLVKITDSAENSWVVDMISSKYMLKLMIRMNTFLLQKQRKEKKSIILNKNQNS